MGFIGAQDSRIQGFKILSLNDLVSLLIGRSASWIFSIVNLSVKPRPKDGRVFEFQVIRSRRTIKRRFPYDYV